MGNVFFLLWTPFCFWPVFTWRLQGFVRNTVLSCWLKALCLGPFASCFHMLFTFSIEQPRHSPDAASALPSLTCWDWQGLVHRYWGQERWRHRAQYSNHSGGSQPNVGLQSPKLRWDIVPGTADWDLISFGDNTGSSHATHPFILVI